MLLFRLGWRNLWRNPKRSALTIAGLAFGYAFLIILMGLMTGMSSQMLSNGTGLLTGDMQIHHSDYLPGRGLFETLDRDYPLDLDVLLSDLEEDPEVEAVAPRTYGFGLVSTGEHSAGAQLMGIDPEREVRLSQFLSGLAEGRLLDRPARRELLLGDGLARELGAGLDSMVAVVTQAADGSLGNDLFSVAGIVHTGIRSLDRSLAVCDQEDLQNLLSFGPDTVHEIAVRTKEVMQADRVAEALNAGGRLPPGAEALSWSELSPQLRDYVGLAEGANGIVIFIIALFTGAGVLNTMMMAVFERTREIGLVSCVGMGPGPLVGMILLESVFLCLLGLALGLGMGAWAMSYLVEQGLDLTRWMGEISMLGTRMDPVLRARWSWPGVGWSALGLMGTTLVGALIPASRAAAIRPVEALSAPVGG